MARKPTGDIMGEALKGTPGAKGALSAKSAPGAEGAASEFTKRGIEIRQEYHDKLKAISYWERRRIRDHIDEALKAYLEEKKPKAIPERS